VVGSEGLMLTCDSMISYPNYKFIFPVKALGMYAKRFGDEALLWGVCQEKLPVGKAKRWVVCEG
jgi:hypothetical protein